MAYHTSNVMVDSSPSPPGSPGPSQQHRLLNRVSTLFGGGKKKGANMVSASSSSPSADNESIAASQVDSMLIDDRTASCVDSMYSSLQSRRSNYRPPQTNTQNVPAPLRTVQLDNPIVHLPTPPPPSISTPLDNNQHTVKPSQTYSTPLHTPSPSPTSMTDKKTMKAKTTAQKIEDIDAQFNLLMREYAPSAHGANNVLNLTFEQKEELIRSSKSPELLRKNSSFSNVMPAFSLKATFGIKSSKNKRGFPEYTTVSSSPMHDEDTSFSDLMTSVKANTAPGRHGKTSRSVLPMASGFQSYGRSKTTRSKLKSTPDYFVHLLRETHVRDLQDDEVLQLQVFLRNVVVSWTSEFLAKGGYDAIADLFKQMKEAPKRFPNDNRILQHLGKCLKTIMTHQPMGTQIVLTNPIALHHVRDILFGPTNKKQKQVYGLDISTRSQLLNLLCTLATIQTNRTSEYEYVHGYDVLRRLLLNKPSDHKIEDDDDKKNQQKHVSPFPITLKTDPKEILQMIMENDPNGQAIGQEYQWDRDELKPRYTAWMRELHFTVEKHIETITFLASALNYNFDSAYRQIKMRQDQNDNTEAPSTTVMCEEGVVDYIVTHLRLIRTVVTTQPTSYTGNYDAREQEKMRLELMLSGFDRISKILIQCPHPMIRSSYINYLKPLMNPCADLTTSPVAHPFPEAYFEQPTQENFVVQESDDDDHVTYEEVSVYADHEDMEDIEETQERQWRYEDNPYYDDIFYDEEDRFDTNDEDGMSDVSMGTYHTEERHYYSNNNYYAATTTST